MQLQEKIGRPRGQTSGVFLFRLTLSLSIIIISTISLHHLRIHVSLTVSHIFFKKSHLDCRRKVNFICAFHTSISCEDNNAKNKYIFHIRAFFSLLVITG
jgi:hypothetical protein